MAIFSRFAVALVATFALAWSSACATAPIPRLPTPLAGEADAELMGAHNRLTRAYETCSDEYFSESIPLPLLFTGATATSTLALVAASGALAFVLPAPYGAGAAVGAGAAAVLFAGLTVFFGGDILPYYGRANVREAALQKARYDAQKALRTRDPAEVDRVTRRLYENCRIAEFTPSEDAAATMMRDFERYRREADAQRRWVKTLEGQRELEQKELEALRKKIAGGAPVQKEGGAKVISVVVADPIARVNGVNIAREEFDTAVRAEPGTTLAQKQARVLARRVLVKLAVVRAPKLGVSLSTDDWQRIRAEGVRLAGGPDAFAAAVATSGKTELGYLEPIAERILSKRVFTRLKAAGEDPTEALLRTARVDVFIEGVTPAAVLAEAALVPTL